MLATDPTKYGKHPEEYRRYRNTKDYCNLMTECSKVMGAGLDKFCMDNNIKIMAKKTDSIFFSNPTGRESDLIDEYFESCGLQIKTTIFSKFIHGMPINTAKSVSSYIGIV